MKSSAAIFTLIVSLLLASAQAQDQRAPPIDDVRALRDQLAQVRGVQIRTGGVDMLAAQKALAEAILDLDRRLSVLEAQRQK